MQQRRRDGHRIAVAVLTATVLSSLLVGAVAASSPGTNTSSVGTVAAESPDGADGQRTGAVGLDPAGTAATPGLAQSVDADRTRIRIALQPDGDARWTVELWTQLADDADEEAFASLQADVRNDSDAYTTDFRGRMNGSIVAASDATGREMTIENLTVSTRTEGVPSSYGILVYEFEWTNFAAVDGNRLRAGDAIDGFLLEERTRLTVGWPDGYRTASVEPAPDDRTDSAVVWQGAETDFVAGQPRIVVTSAPTDDAIVPAAAAIVVAVLAALLLLAWLGRSGRLSLPGRGDGSDAATAGDGAETATGADAGEASAAATPAGATETGDPDGDGASNEDDRSGQTDDDPPPELLSNEEQVLRLLEAHGGRMKQQQVVAELEWTEAKTSQVVTGMREDDRVEVFRIGRENVLALPGEADL